MNIHSLCDRYAAFTIDSSHAAGKEEAERILRYMLRARNMKQWDKIHFDVFICDKETLYLAYPEEKIKVTIAPYALPYIEEYFTE